MESPRNSPRRPKPALLTSRSIGISPFESCSVRTWPAPGKDRSACIAITATDMDRRNWSANAWRGSADRATRTRLQWRSASARANAIPSPREAPVMSAKPSYFISVLAQGSAHRFREASIEHAVPETSADAIALVDPTGAVVVQVIFLHPPKEGEPGIRKMQRIVKPLFADVALYDTGEYDGRCIDGKQKAGGRGNEKQRQNILQLTADVPSIEWPHVMIPMERIEPLVQKSADDASAWRKTAMQNIAVEEIFDERPGCATCREESYCCPSVLCRKRESEHENRIQGVEDGERVETMASKSGLTRLVGLKRDLRGPVHWWRNDCGL